MASQLTNMILAALKAPLFWVGIVAVVLVGFILFLYFRRKRRFSIKGLTLVYLKDGEIEYQNTKFAKLGEKLMFRGFLWFGKEQIYDEDNTKLRGFATDDYHFIDGDLGIIALKHPDDPNILVTIHKGQFDILNKKVLYELAPIQLREVGAEEIENIISETKKPNAELIQAIIWGLIIVFSLITIIVVIQFIKQSQDKSAELILQAGKQAADTCANICRVAAQEICKGGTASGAP